MKPPVSAPRRAAHVGIEEGIRRQFCEILSRMGEGGSNAAALRRAAATGGPGETETGGGR